MELRQRDNLISPLPKSGKNRIKDYGSAVAATMRVMEDQYRAGTNVSKYVPCLESRTSHIRITRDNVAEGSSITEALRDCKHPTSEYPGCWTEPSYYPKGY
jgi:hypothetical protein